MKNIRSNRGFTLIELLVVIAVIGIMSSVVLGFLNGARVKSADNGVKSNMLSIRQSAELYYDNNSATYGTFTVATCPVAVTAGSLFNDAKIIAAINAALASGGNNGTRCVASVSTYAVAVGMKTANQSWCVDSSGVPKLYAGTPTAAITGGLCS